MAKRLPPIEVLGEIDSTNAEARRRAESGSLGPVWICAARQTAGHGRRGRAWETGQGNLAATWLGATQKPPAEAAQVSFVAALAVAELADRFVSDAPIRLKWPNDLLVAERKCAGVLVESGPGPGGGLWLAVGIGVNLATPPTAPAYPATTFAQHMRLAPPTAGQAMSVLAESFLAWLTVWERLGFAPIAEAWTARAHGLGETCTARLPSETICGVAEGLDADGALRLRTAAGAVRRITAGDVFFGSA